MSYKVLLVDDEPDILEFVSYNLTKEGFDVYTASNGKEAVTKALEIIPHLVILDVMMPVMDGVEACEQMRSYEQLKHTIIAFLTARGADDYISKPISPKVLVSRVKALLKRLDAGEGGNEHDQEKYLRIDRERYLVITETGKELSLPRKEFELLALLYSKPHKVFSREEIFSAVWGDDVIVGDRTIDVHIRKLREKIGENHIVTIKGVGYKYE